MDKLVKSNNFKSREDLLKASLNHYLQEASEKEKFYRRMDKIADKKGITKDDIIKKCKKVGKRVYREEYGVD
jgi:Arc/MetJ-type ribon-helix-helix transcriptional regulator